MSLFVIFPHLLSTYVFILYIFSCEIFTFSFSSSPPLSFSLFFSFFLHFELLLFGLPVWCLKWQCRGSEVQTFLFPLPSNSKPATFFLLGIPGAHAVAEVFLHIDINLKFNFNPECKFKDHMNCFLFSLWLIFNSHPSHVTSVAFQLKYTYPKLSKPLINFIFRCYKTEWGMRLGVHTCKNVQISGYMLRFCCLLSHSIITHIFMIAVTFLKQYITVWFCAGTHWLYKLYCIWRHVL